MPYNKKVTKEIRRAVEEELKAGVPIKSLLEKYPVAKSTVTRWKSEMKHRPELINVSKLIKEDSVNKTGLVINSGKFNVEIQENFNANLLLSILKVIKDV